MSTAILRPIYALMAACLSFTAFQAQAQDSEPLPGSQAAPMSAEPAGEEISDLEVKADRGWHRPYRYRHRSHDSGMVSIGHDAHLPSGEKVSSVVSIFGSSTAEGEVEDGVVSIIGNSRATGPVGDAVVAVMGDVYIDSKIGGDAVAVLGSIELGPNAEVDGDVVVIGGALTRAPTASVHGSVDRVATGIAPQFGWFHAWVKHCLMYGRPLALQPGLEWAWAFAFGFLAFYMLLALMFRSSVDRCVQTLETQPGRSTVASILALVLTPVAFVVLCVTVIGIALVPFLWIGLMCAGLFGKAVMLAALGRRVTRFFGNGPQSHTAIAVFIGGLFVTALYLVPVVGFIVFKLLGILGFGVVVYTLLLAAKAAKRERNAVSPPVFTAPPIAPAPSVGAGASFATADADASNADPAPSAAQDAGPAVSEQPTVPPATLPLADFKIRMGALLIDMVLIGIVLKILNLFADAPFLLLLALYGVMMWKVRGTTIGGIVCGLQVVRSDGRPVDWTTAIVRALSCFLSLGAVGLGFLWIAFDDRKQGWHDKIAGTLVVRASKGISLV